MDRNGTWRSKRTANFFCLLPCVPLYTFAFRGSLPLRRERVHALLQLLYPHTTVHITLACSHSALPHLPWATAVCPVTALRTPQEQLCWRASS